MKRWMTILLALAMLLALVGCGSKSAREEGSETAAEVEPVEEVEAEPEEEPAAEPEAPVEEEPAVEQETPAEEPSVEQETPDEEPAEEPEEASDEETAEEPVEDAAEQEASVSEGAPEGIAEAQDYLEPTAAAPLGAWVKATKYNAVSGEYETIYWRVVETTKDCQADIDAYNEGDHFYVLDPLEDEALAYYEVTYEVYFPEDFSAQEWGISSFDLSLSAMNPEGGGFKYKGVSYIGLGSTVGITSLDMDDYPMPGDTVTLKSIYIMLDEEPEYVFRYSYTDATGEFADCYASNR